MICAFPGNEAFAASLRRELHEDAVELQARRFPDRESYLRFGTTIAGRDLALVCTLDDPDAKALPLLLAARAAKDLGAHRVGLVAPYLAYMRQDARFVAGEAVTSVHFAELLSGTFDWLVTVDPHLHRHASLADLYAIPARAVAAAPAIARWIAANVERPLVVGPDEESEPWAASVARACGAPHVVLRKVRLGDRDVRIEAPALRSYATHAPVLVDDIISSGSTMAGAATALRAAGLPPPACVGVHAVFAPGALATLRRAGVAKVVTTNTVGHRTSRIDVAREVADGVRAVRRHPRGARA
jgi:ribose-phosphate pyrophosphokinase